MDELFTHTEAYQPLTISIRNHLDDHIISIRGEVWSI